MRLLTAHRILITAAAGFFGFLALWELNRYLEAGSAWAAARSLVYLGVAAGFAVYLKLLRRWYR
jgi:hypothetical protein